MFKHDAGQVRAGLPPAGSNLIRPHTHPRLTGSHRPPNGVDCRRAAARETCGCLLVIVAVAIATQVRLPVAGRGSYGTKWMPR
jgi:hypothetical protein